MSSCKKSDFKIENLNGNKISVLGHGGMGIGHLYPMNTFESIYQFLSLGADGVEIDVQMTKDNVLVAFHDFELSKRTNLSGHIFQKSWDELKDTHYNYPLFTKYSLLSLDSLFSNLGQFKNKTFALDCRNYDPDHSYQYVDRFCTALLSLIDKFDIQNNVIVELNREAIMKELKLRRPELKVFVYQDFLIAMRLAEMYDLDGIVVAVNEISKEQVAFAHDTGLIVTAFNAHSSKRNIDAVKKNVDIIQTDKLKHLLSLLN